MKPGTFIPPALVIIAGGLWLGSQTATISRIEKENTRLGEKISARIARPSTTIASEGKPRRDHPAPAAARAKDPIDWKSVAAQFAEMQRSGGMGDMRTMVRFQQRLHSMTAEELGASLDEIAALDLPEQSRLTLEQMLAGPLATKDPKLALDRFLGRIHENHGIWSWQLSTAFKGWAEKDLPAATTWFDQQIAAGTFDSKSLDGKSRGRQNFEGAFIATLLPSDPDAASRRLSALPEDQRTEVLSHHEFSNIKEKDQVALAALIRQQLPEQSQADAIANPAAQIASHSDYSKITEYLDRIAATPEERAATVEKAAETRIGTLAENQKITTTEIDEMRVWAAAQASGSENKATGKALAQLSASNDKAKFADAAQLALQYHESSGTDDVLATFLGGWAARSNKDISRPFAEKISDEKRRNEILRQLK